MVGRRLHTLGWMACACLALGVAGCARPLLRGPSHGGPEAADARAKHAGPVDLQDRAWRTADGAATGRAPTLHAAEFRADASAFLRTALRASTTSEATRPPARSGRGAAADAVSFLLPMELDFDSGAANGNAVMLRLLPAYEWPRKSRWQIQHMDIITLADAPGGVPGRPGNPEPVPGRRATGLGDLVHASFFVPKLAGPFILGAGAAVGLPTATDEVLGSGKWSAGPALRVTYRKGPWNLGALAAQRWSFAGDADRGDISQLMIRGTFRRQLGDEWFLISAPIITANWHASSGSRWLVPLGGGIGRKFEFLGLGWAVSVQGYANVIKPNGAPDWSVRLGLIAIIPGR